MLRNAASGQSCLLLKGHSVLGHRGFATELTAGMTLLNKGLKVGPGGRSSVSGITATVFGATGFLARYIINTLAKAGSQVVMPYRCDDLDVQHLRTMGDLGQMVQVKSFDARDDDSIRHLIHRSNLVINLIGIQKETMNWSFQETHVDVAARIAQACKENELIERFWHVGCLGANENSTSRRLQSKFEGEKVVREIYPEATIFKPGQLVGVEDNLLNNLARLAKKFPVIPLIDGGHQKLQPTYVKDVANAMINSLKTKECLGSTYHLAGPDVITQKELVRLTFDTIRERYHAMPLPSQIAKILTAPREAILNKVPLPINYLFTQDYVAECMQDQILPTGSDVKVFQDLEIQPRSILSGEPIEHIRHFRVGGYELGTTGSGGGGQGLLDKQHDGGRATT
ncbi:hypothetical protein ABBQ32_013898 [Trebouxia sp. C0010 RCD-2024]